MIHISDNSVIFSLSICIFTVPYYIINVLLIFVCQDLNRHPEKRDATRYEL